MAEIPKSWVVYGAAGLVGLALLTGLVFVLSIRPQEPGLQTDPRGPEFVFPDSGAKGPGEKILQGADQAFETRYFPTALKFYRDFDLRYAGTDAYDGQASRVWDRMLAADALCPERDAALPEYLGTRRALDAEWKRLKARPRSEAKGELRAFAQKLPPDDGRRAIIDGWLSETAPPR